MTQKAFILPLSIALCQQMAGVYSSAVNKEQEITGALDEVGLNAVQNKTEKSLSNIIISYLFPKSITYPASLKKLEKNVKQAKQKEDARENTQQSGKSTKPS